MVKAILRSSLAQVLYYSGILKIAELKLHKSLTVLCYHRILPKELKSSSTLPDLVVTPETFDAHCKFLAAHFEVQTLCKACDLLQNGYSGKRPLAVITFDDGYRDNIRYASPILKTHGLQATFFIISGLAGKTECPWYDRLNHAVSTLITHGKLEECLNGSSLHYLFEGNGSPTPKEIVQAAKKMSPEERFLVVSQLAAQIGANGMDSELNWIMSLTELKILQEEGHEIGSHTVSHEILPLLDDIGINAEVSESKEFLECGLNSQVRSFCYPNGDYNSATLEAVKAAKYSYACTTHKGNNASMRSPYELRRWFINENHLLNPNGKPSSQLLRLEITGLADRIFLRNAFRSSI